MNLSQFAVNMIPAFVLNRIRLQRELKRLNSTQIQNCSTENLRYASNISLADIYNSSYASSKWLEAESPLRQDSCTIIPEIHSGAVGATKCHVIQPKENTLY